MDVPARFIPVFFHPETRPESWRRLLAAPPRMAAVAPDGPAFQRAVGALQAAGTEVLGHVDTDFGLRPIADVRADLRRLRNGYGLRGVFLDQAAACADRLDHYREIVDGVRGTIVLNPGVYPDPGYAALADVLVTFDGPLPAYRAMREPAWARSLARGRFCHLVHEVPGQAADATVRRAVRHAGLVHVTDRPGTDPWGDLPAYHRSSPMAG
ncbi:spherulation-specific family 4 protein [Nonomuraea sp. NPDC046570]|uniref:spherulation-specific family 4 protein n=1 Tax=Nonomuraea sp. NPDC046570 TaxID=3155255 RepID=UPI0033FD0876